MNMARRNYRNRSRRRNDKGLEYALQHIEEAKQLSRELGGTDKDVKAYFFCLSAAELGPILDEYERQYGASSREYAEKTLPQWKSGRRKMSGLVAGRLFSLLPRRMPLEKKYDLVKTLWESKCPSSRAIFYIGPDTDAATVATVVTGRLSEVVDEYTIPDEIVNRFKWLAEDDVDLQQQLYNYFLQLTREAISIATEERIPAILQSLAGSDGVSRRVNQDIKVGRHTVSLRFDANAVGISRQPPLAKPSVASRTSDTGCLVAVAALVLLILLLGNVG